MVYKSTAAGLVLETAGPIWHLIGTITRTAPNQLTFTRAVDSLTPKINAAIGKLLPAVQLTDPNGTSASITMVKMSIPGPSVSDPWMSMAMVMTTETLLFTYNIITPISTGTTTTTTGPTNGDDWTMPV